MLYSQYAGPTRIPPPCMQLRARREAPTRDAANARQFEHWQTDAPIPQDKYPKNVYSNMRPGEINDLLRQRSITVKPEATLGDRIQALLDYDVEEAGIFRRDYAKDAIFDMTPIASRSDSRDFRQARPFDEMGPSLALNPYFDRYDPTRDPRNAVRELRSVVSELKDTEKGVLESKALLGREFANRWLPEGYVEQERVDSLLAYEMIRPKMDSIEKTYRKPAS